MKITAKRKAIGMTQAELAAFCATTQQQIAKIEGGIVDPRLSTLRRIAEALGCEVGELFYSREEFLHEIRAVAESLRLDLRKTKLTELSLLCAKERSIPIFQPFWEKIQIAGNRIVIKD